LVFTVSLQFVAFVVAATYQTELFYDVVGGLNFLCLAYIGYPKSYSSSSPLLLWYVTVLFVISRGWLLVFLAWRAHSRKGDSRFDDVKTRPATFFVYWMVQACWVYVISIPLLILQQDGSGSPSGSLTTTQVVLLVGFAFAVTMEITSDVQKAVWVEQGRTGGFCTVGWWRFSRHPNYAGEILQWWCAALLCLVSSTSSSSSSFAVVPWIGLLSPLFTMVILLTLPGTGICHAEGKNLKRYYESDKLRGRYEEYRSQTPPLFPLFVPGLYRSLPLTVKRRLFFEWERYEYRPSTKSS
jgi:steroid 5-alpha reductase family enzyme